jgi:hypothetical protein
MSSADTDGINPAYDEQSGYDTSDNRYPPDWDARKEAIKRRDSYTCQDCGIEAGEGKMLDVHHIQPLSNGGPNRLSNLELLCIDCHNDRHDHDIREGREAYKPAPTIWDRLRQLVRSVVGGAVVLPIHGAALYVLLTQSVGSTVWLVGAAYLMLVAIGLLLRPGPTAALYGLAGGLGVVIVEGASVTEIASVSTRLLVFTAFIPALLALAWWWQRR